MRGAGHEQLESRGRQDILEDGIDFLLALCDGEWKVSGSASANTSVVHRQADDAHLQERRQPRPQPCLGPWASVPQRRQRPPALHLAALGSVSSSFSFLALRAAAAAGLRRGRRTRMEVARSACFSLLQPLVALARLAANFKFLNRRAALTPRTHRLFFKANKVIGRQRGSGIGLTNKQKELLC